MITTSVAEAAQCLSQGKVLAYPTEAVWGLGCDPLNEQAFLEILRLKQRPIEKGVILLAGEINQVEHLLVSLSPTLRNKVIASCQIDGKANAPPHGCYLPSNTFQRGLRGNMNSLLYVSAPIHYVQPYAKPLMVLLCPPVPTQPA